MTPLTECWAWPSGSWFPGAGWCCLHIAVGTLEAELTGADFQQVSVETDAGLSVVTAVKP